MVMGWDDALILGAITAAGTAASAGAQYAGAQQVNSANAANTVLGINFAREQRNWQELMSNTAYQRATADMKAAGINPMLAYSQGGASSPTPTGQATFGQPQNKMGAAATGAQNMASTMANLYTTAIQGENTKANTDLARQSISESVAREGNYSAQTVAALANTRLIKQDTLRSAANTALAQAGVPLTNAQTARTQAETATELERPEQVRQQARVGREEEQTGIIRNSHMLRWGYQPTPWSNHASAAEAAFRYRLPNTAAAVSRYFSRPWF